MTLLPRRLLRIGLLLTVGACALPLASASVTGSRGLTPHSGRAVSVPPASLTPTEPPTPAEIVATRQDLVAVVEGYGAVSEAGGMTDVRAAMKGMREDVAAMSDEQLAPLAGLRPQIEALRDRLRDLASVLDRSAARAKSGSVAKTAGLPDPDYSAYCGDREIDSDGLFAALAVREAAKLVAVIAQDLCNETIVVLCAGGNGSIACIITDTIYNVAEIVYGELEFCRDQIAGDRADAVYERLQHIHEDIELMQIDVTFIKEAVTCRIVLPLRLGSGCNGNDEDCDMPKKIDECDEDVFGPSVYIAPAVSVPWYRNVAEARTAVAEATVAVDDCQRVTVNQPVFSGACGLVQVSVTAIDACQNSTTATTTVRIDGTPPQVIIPPSLEGRCFPDVATAEATVRAAALISDDCTPLAELNVRLDSSVSACGMRIRIEATNLAGQRATDAVTVRVDPNPPVIRIDESVSMPWYRSAGEALAAVQRAIHVVDGCEETNMEAPILTGACGNVIATVRAVDTCGNAVSQQAVVHVDGAPPTITIPPALAFNCYSTLEAAEAAVRNQTSISDDCTPPQDIAVTFDSSVADCAPRIRITAVDKAGRGSSAAVTVHVDASPPKVRIDRLLLGFKSEVLGFQTPRCYRSTADAEAAVLAVASATDGCTPGAGITLTASSSGSPCALRVTVRGVDACGLAGTDFVDVRVDATAPVVSCSVVTNRLTPADKRMVDVGFTWAVNDACEPGLAPVITVTTDEPTWAAGASPAPDAEIRRDAAGVVRFVRLRAEAATGGNGRVYRINVQATDACGNTGSNAVLVTVPNPANLAVDSGQYYDATAVN